MGYNRKTRRRPFTPKGKGQRNERLVIGILAHVDSGKTTLSEALLYRAGALRKLGRVDHRDAFLDTDALERSRGITIFSKQAVLSLGDSQLTLLDTPGHVDFSAEAERALQVMDYASWWSAAPTASKATRRPCGGFWSATRCRVFLFVNKMDLAGADRDLSMDGLRRRFGDRCGGSFKPRGGGGPGPVQRGAAGGGHGGQGAHR